MCKEKEDCLHGNPRLRGPINFCSKSRKDTGLGCSSVSGENMPSGRCCGSPNDLQVRLIRNIVIIFESDQISKETSNTKVGTTSRAMVENS